MVISMSARQKRGGAGRLGTEFMKRASLGKMVDRTKAPTGRAKHVVTVGAGGLARFFQPVAERI